MTTTGASGIDGSRELRALRAAIKLALQLQRYRGICVNTTAGGTMRSLDEEIAKHLQEALSTGELSRAPSYGKPLRADDGWDETPADLRMPFKILKDAGVPPPEIELFHRRALLRNQLQSAAEGEARSALQKALAELEQVIALRLEALRSGSR